MHGCLLVMPVRLYKFHITQLSHFHCTRITMERLDSEKRKQMLSLEGYMYVKQKVLAGGIVSYECKERRNGRCKAKVKVLDDEIVGRTHEHTHAPDGRKVEAKRAAQEIRQRAEDTRETP